jgi:hypothetical protein
MILMRLVKLESKRQAVDEVANDFRMMVSKRTISIDEYLDIIRILSAKQFKAVYTMRKILSR